MKTKLFLLAFALVCFKLADYAAVLTFASDHETGYTQSQRTAMHELVRRVDEGVAFDTKTRPVMLYRTQAERDEKIAEIYMAGRQ